MRNLSVELASRGHDVHVACLDVGTPPQLDPGVTVHALHNVGVKVPALYPTADRPLALPMPDPLASRALSRVIGEVRPDVVHAHNWVINSYLPLTAARRLPLVYSLHDYSHVCATKRLMYDDEPCSGPAPRKCLECSTDWYGAGRGPVIWSLVRSGRPVRNRVVDLFTPVSRFVGAGQPAGRAGRPVGGRPQLRAGLPPVRPRPAPGPCAARGRLPLLRRRPVRAEGGRTPSWRRTPPSTRPPGRHSCSSAAPRWTCPRSPRARSSTRSGSTSGCCPASVTRWPRCCRAGGPTRARPPCSRRWHSGPRWSPRTWAGSRTWSSTVSPPSSSRPVTSAATAAALTRMVADPASRPALRPGVGGGRGATSRARSPPSSRGSTNGSSRAHVAPGGRWLRALGAGRPAHARRGAPRRCLSARSLARNGPWLTARRARRVADREERPGHAGRHQRGAEQVEADEDDGQVGGVLDEADDALRELDAEQDGDGATGDAGAPAASSAKQQADGQADEQEHQVGVQLAHRRAGRGRCAAESSSPACGPEPVTTVPT